MGKIVIFSLIPFFLLSCKKDKTILSCEGIEMIGDKSRLVGKWIWYETLVEQWFDVGPSNYLFYTPQNQGFEYYFTISSDGLFQDFRNDSLIQEFLLSEVDFENFQATGTGANGIRFKVDCSESTFSISQPIPNVTNDSIFSLQYPLDFDDQANHLRSKINYFVKE